jgi:hypothetical protein
MAFEGKTPLAPAPLYLHAFGFGALSTKLDRLFLSSNTVYNRIFVGFYYEAGNGRCHVDGWSLCI